MRSGAGTRAENFTGVPPEPHLVLSPQTPACPADRNSRHILTNARSSARVALLCPCGNEDKCPSRNNLHVDLGDCSQSAQVTRVAQMAAPTSYSETSPKCPSRNNLHVDLGDCSQSAQVT